MGVMNKARQTRLDKAGVLFLQGIRYGTARLLHSATGTSKYVLAICIEL